jgi:hypothetical protein
MMIMIMVQTYIATYQESHSTDSKPQLWLLYEAFKY